MLIGWRVFFVDWSVSFFCCLYDGCSHPSGGASHMVHVIKPANWDAVCCMIAGWTQEQRELLLRRRVKREHQDKTDDDLQRSATTMKAHRLKHFRMCSQRQPQDFSDTEYVQGLILSDVRFTETTNTKVINSWLRNKMSYRGIADRQGEIKKAVEGLQSSGLITVEAAPRQKGRQIMTVSKKRCRQIQDNPAAAKLLKKLNASILSFK